MTWHDGLGEEIAETFRSHEGALPPEDMKGLRVFKSFAQWDIENPDAKRRRKKEWRVRNREKHNAYMREYLREYRARKKAA